MPVLNDNPFAALTVVMAPAILTNACSVLSLGTANRIARVVDRTRIVAAAREIAATGSADREMRSRELEQLQARGALLLRALRIIYLSLGAFAASALTAVAGSVSSAYDLQLFSRATAVIGFATGTLGVSMLVMGCALMVRETRLAIQSMAGEVERALKL